MFNAFARELVLLVKNRLPPAQKSVLKKRFRLFDLNSSKHADEFLALRKRTANSSGTDDTTDDLVFEGISARAITDAVPASDRDTAAGLISGMKLCATLLDDDSSDELSARIAGAIVSEDLACVEDVIVDDELAQMLAKSAAFELPDRLSADLTTISAEPAASATAAAMAARTNSPLGIVGLAEEISRELDLSSLMTPAGPRGGETGLASVIQTINQKVRGRIQDGSVDAAQLCSEAQAILGQIPNGGKTAK